MGIRVIAAHVYGLGLKWCGASEKTDGDTDRHNKLVSQFDLGNTIGLCFGYRFFNGEGDGVYVVCVICVGSYQLQNL